MQVWALNVIISSVHSLIHVNSVNSVSSLLRGATSIFDGISFFRKVSNADFDYFCVLTYYPVPEKTTTMVETKWQSYLRRT